MIISTQHLLPSTIPPPAPPSLVEIPTLSELPAMEMVINENYGRPRFSVVPETESQLSTSTGDSPSKFVSSNTGEIEARPNDSHHSDPSLSQERASELTVPSTEKVQQQPLHHGDNQEQDSTTLTSMGPAATEVKQSAQNQQQEEQQSEENVITAGEKFFCEVCGKRI
jgi:hypothetical protein